VREEEDLLTGAQKGGATSLMVCKSDDLRTDLMVTSMFRVFNALWAKVWICMAY
jgi:hypothetical protein